MHDTQNESFYDDVLYFNDTHYLHRVIDGNIYSEDCVGKNVLDLGCGAGEASAIFADKGACSVFAVDVGKQNIIHARNTHGSLTNLTFSRQDLNYFDLGEDAYDLIWCDTVIELLKRPLDAFAIDLFRSLKPGGILYISLTEKTTFNVLLYAILRMSNNPVLRPLIGLLKAVAIMRYRLSGATIDEENLKGKLKYLTIPFIRLISREQASTVLERAGFRIDYVRDRIKSDPNSPPHFEIRVKKPVS